MHDWWTLAVITAYNIGDAYRDASLYKPFAVRGCFPEWTPFQWRWHVVKWATTYPVQLTLLFNGGYRWPEIALIATAMFFIWRGVYNLTLK